MEYISKIYEYYETYNAAYGLYEIGFELFLILILSLKIKTVISKITNEEKWTQSDRLRGLDASLLASEPKSSKISINLNIIFVISLIFGAYGLYQSFTQKEYLDASMTIFSFSLWVLVGLLSLILSIKLNNFNKTLHLYHVNWIRNNFKDYIEKARDLFTLYVMLNIFKDNDKLIPMKPFVYTFIEGENKNWIHPSFYEKYYFKGIFPEMKTSIFFIEGKSKLSISLIPTIKKFYTAEFYNETYADETSNKLITYIQNHKISESLSKLDYESAGLDNEIINTSFSDINPDASKSLFIGIYKLENYTELFYQDVARVQKVDQNLVLKFKHGEEKIIEGSEFNSQLEDHVIKEIQSKIREFK